ncbi:hypothetical protein RMCBS344292_17171 [Rhizopus microsporus]|nr:hypothetical protein RMCBS344292_17171 [Rhizopus microsporus]
MQMDGKPTGEDGATDSGDRRSSAPRMIPTERCKPGTQERLLQMGQPMSTLTTRTTIPSLVGTVGQTEERIANTNITSEPSKDRPSDSRRCFRRWMGYSFKPHTDFRVLDSSRKRPLHQCEGIEGDAFCLTNARYKRKR